MNTRRILMLCLILGIAKSSFGQSFSAEVLSSAGGYDRNDKWILEWTLGETVAETYSASDGIVTQGFNQPSWKFSSQSIFSSDFDVTVFPNPVLERVVVYFSEPLDSKMIITVYDLFGKELSMNISEPASESAEIDFQKFKAGIYLLSCTRSTGEMVRTFRLTKAY